MKYESLITKIGVDVYELYKKNDCIILFDESAPKDLEDISVMHRNINYKDEVKRGDTLQIGEDEYKVRFVGDEANKTLKELGHCTFVFSEDLKNDELLPGQILLSGKKSKKVNKGDIIKFY